MSSTQTPGTTFIDALATNGLTLEVFFRDYWQQKPLYLSGLAPDWHLNINADTLAGLSLENALDSRMVIGGPNQERSVKHGPFTAKDFARREQSPEPWTLLVHGVDRALPAVRATLDFWSGFPHWRMDDVMVSYATQHGGVGPHFDEYDVFLIQIQGNRQWTVGECCSSNTPLLPHQDLKLLATMGVHTQDWLVKPGDALYIPARMAHNGVACEESITWSMGFRSPSWGEALSSLVDHLLEHDPFAAERYQDTNTTLMAPDHNDPPGLVNSKTIERFKSTVQSWIQHSSEFDPWLGAFLSGYKQLGESTPPLEKSLNQIAQMLRQCIESNGFLIRDEDTGVLYTQASEFRLFVNGFEIPCPSHLMPLAKLIANHHRLPLPSLYQLLSSEEAIMWLADLVNKGFFYLE